MSYSFDSRLGEQLYRLLPEVYRTRDKKGAGETGVVDDSLARYLDAHGHLLDLIHAMLEQQLKDALPESSQGWLLPYFARLVAVRIVSPDSRGRHAEVANAIGWRQRKGSLKCAEEIAEALAGVEAEIQEGWKRVAVTPRIGMPIIPASAIDKTLGTLKINESPAYEVIAHPSLPAVMSDMRTLSRALVSKSDNPAGKSSVLRGVTHTWRQLNRHGAPCFPGSYEDVSRRTVDLRTPDHTNGRYHHKRLLVFTPPPTGFFGLEPKRLDWSDLEEHKNIIEQVTKNEITSIRNVSGRRVVINDDVTLTGNYIIEGLVFDKTLEISDGCRIELASVETEMLRAKTFSGDEPVVAAVDSLFGDFSAGNHLVTLDSCTVLRKASMSIVEARDCIFMEIEGEEIEGAFEYCRIPDDSRLSKDPSKISIKSHNANINSKYGYVPVFDDPEFIDGQTFLAAQAVLSPKAPGAVYAGASDHGEMGYYHRGRSYPVHITNTKTKELTVPEDGGYRLDDLIFDEEVTVSEDSGTLTLSRVAAPSLVVGKPLNTSGAAVPSLHAVDCLFQSINVPAGLARLEYCTVMETADCKHLQASDCIFAGSIVNTVVPKTKKEKPTFFNCLRYSVVPSDLSTDLRILFRLINEKGELTLGSNTMLKTVFGKFRYCKDGHGSQIQLRSPKYNEWGYGVPGPLTPDAIRFGAEDGGEMGATHHKYYALKAKAMVEKMREFLPVGIEPVVIQDERMLHEPPKEIES